MTGHDFRRLALGLTGAIERAHMNHPDFRAGGKVFATLGYPENGWGMVKLTPEQQHDYMVRAPDSFKPAAGAWGRVGSTLVRLETVDEAILLEALKLACLQAATKKAAPKKAPKRTRT